MLKGEHESGFKQSRIFWNVGFIRMIFSWHEHMVCSTNISVFIKMWRYIWYLGCLIYDISGVWYNYDISGVWLKGLTQSCLVDDKLLHVSNRGQSFDPILCGLAWL